MTENHSFGCIEDQIAMGLHNFGLGKSQVYQKPKETIEELVEKYWNKIWICSNTSLIKPMLIEFANEVTELQEVNELREQYYADVEIVEKSSIAIKQLIKSKEIINNLLSDNRIMIAQFESEEQGQTWFEHIEQAEAFLKE